MSDSVSISHATFGLMGPLAHTPTQSMAIHCVIFQIGERVILLDTGFGTREMLDPNELLGQDALFKLGIIIDMRLTAVHHLKAMGISPDQVTDVILTHLDNDHAGGLYDFPNATVHLANEELDAFDGLRPRGPYKPYQISHRTKFQTYDKSDEAWFGLEARSLKLPGELDAKLIPLPGHTVGHCGVAFRDGEKWCLHAGDAYFDTNINFLEPPPGLPLEVAFQTDALDRQSSIRKLKKLREEFGGQIDMFCTHDQSEYLSHTAGRGSPDPLAALG
ncbi:MBL fold metallo-hydrolase [Rhizobium leguminosarum]|uniref:MBL fold metallo-hydrolase n=1 Tax=Rhizobium leguminosarum TaxID=384 RepID=UPI001C96E2E2|nr:MBL fold metallo-hydrolase [Rhizobium leguminosarum]MBY5353613.1 MBL fold metallo-hydrolase [Rhizobium leguminosarum]